MIKLLYDSKLKDILCKNTYKGNSQITQYINISDITLTGFELKTINKSPFFFMCYDCYIEEDNTVIGLRFPFEYNNAPEDEHLMDDIIEFDTRSASDLAKVPILWVVTPFGRSIDPIDKKYYYTALCKLYNAKDTNTIFAININELSFLMISYDISSILDKKFISKITNSDRIKCQYLLNPKNYQYSVDSFISFEPLAMYVPPKKLFKKVYRIVIRGILNKSLVVSIPVDVNKEDYNRLDLNIPHTSNPNNSILSDSIDKDKYTIDSVVYDRIKYHYINLSNNTDIYKTAMLCTYDPKNVNAFNLITMYNITCLNPLMDNIESLILK